jgi:hypothetical protein
MQRKTIMRAVALCLFEVMALPALGWAVLVLSGR